MNIRGEREPWDTPCVGQCPRFGDDCRGCGRTAREIENWNQLSRDERAEINRRLARDLLAIQER